MSRPSSESHEEVGDRTNDAIRINGRDLRCKVIGEGGNLGLTQRGRIEYATAGGRINTDFIDNSGGVHCSDREVNLKILLGMAEERGDLDRAGRDELVAAAADDVVAAILYDNFLQAQILSQEVEASAGRLETYEDLMQSLESEELLDRDIEQLPSTEEITERARSGLGLTSPELAVLLAYAKRSLTEALLESDLPDWPTFEADLPTYFAAPVVERFTGSDSSSSSSTGAHRHDGRQRSHQFRRDHLRFSPYRRNRERPGRRGSLLPDRS